MSGIKAFSVLLTALALAACGSPSNENSSTPVTEPDKQTQPSSATESVAAETSQPRLPQQNLSPRAQALIQSLRDAGLNAELRQTVSSRLINSMYGSTHQHHVMVNDRLVIVLEYDLDKLDAVGTNALETVESSGRDSRNSEPAWKSGEFVLLNSASIMDQGQVVARFKVQEHPDREALLAAFAAFE